MSQGKSTNPKSQASNRPAAKVAVTTSANAACASANPAAIGP